MKPAREWLPELARVELPETIKVETGRGGDPTLRIANFYLHSRYHPREEAQRFVEGAKLDMTRPILVVGLGLGYHVLELLERGAEVAAVDPEPAVARLALEGVLEGRGFLLDLGAADTIAADQVFTAFVARVPQILIHPPSARAYPEFTDCVLRETIRLGLGGRPLRIAVVGPMYGGSAPIAGYLANAFKKLGHQSLLIDNTVAWPVYNGVITGVKIKNASQRLANIFTNFMSQWNYVRAVEFCPDICIALAQAPVGPEFPARLASESIVTAFWFVENWRHMSYWREIAPLYDAFFHIQPGEFEQALSDCGCPCHAYAPTACDPDVHRPVTLTPEEQAAYGCDISFAGAGYYNRIQVFRGLTDFNFKLWGVEWNAPELQRLVQNPGERFSAEQFTKIAAASKINLNLHSSAFYPGVDPECDAVNPRVFEIAACGAFQLCDPCKGLEALFDFDTELPVYRDLESLRKAIVHFLARPEERAAFARRARERALREHQYTHRAQAMLDLLIKRYGLRVMNKGVVIQRTIGEMLERVERDSALAAYLATLPPDEPFTQDIINAHLLSARTDLSHPEKVFAFLRELKMNTDLLLAAMD